MEARTYGKTAQPKTPAASFQAAHKDSCQGAQPAGRPLPAKATAPKQKKAAMPRNGPLAMCPARKPCNRDLALRETPHCSHASCGPYLGEQSHEQAGAHGVTQAAEVIADVDKQRRQPSEGKDVLRAKARVACVAAWLSRRLSAACLQKLLHATQLSGSCSV